MSVYFGYNEQAPPTPNKSSNNNTTVEIGDNNSNNTSKKDTLTTTTTSATTSDTSRPSSSLSNKSGTPDKHSPISYQKGTERIGVIGRNDIGLLLWDRDEERTQKWQLGSRLKTPTLPMWVTKVNDQYGVLFNPNKELMRSCHAENRFGYLVFSMFYLHLDTTRFQMAWLQCVLISTMQLHMHRLHISTTCFQCFLHFLITQDFKFQCFII
jgi:hypothetical protein